MGSLVTENNHIKVRTYITLVRCALNYGSTTQDINAIVSTTTVYF